MMIPKEMKFRHQSLVTKANVRKQKAAVVQGQKRKGRQRSVNTLLERKKIMIEPSATGEGDGMCNKIRNNKLEETC